jgi:nitric oxide reductase subunit B
MPYTLRWFRVPGDTVFAIGAFMLTWFVLGTKTGWSLQRVAGSAPAPARPRARVPEPARAEPVEG